MTLFEAYLAQDAMAYPKSGVHTDRHEDSHGDIHVDDPAMDGPSGSEHHHLDEHVDHE